MAFLNPEGATQQMMSRITTRACGNCIGRAMGVERFPGAGRSSARSGLSRGIEKLPEGAHRPAAPVFLAKTSRTPDDGSE